MTLAKRLESLGDRFLQEFEFAPASSLAVEALQANPDDREAAFEYFSRDLGSLALKEGDPERIKETFRKKFLQSKKG